MLIEVVYALENEVFLQEFKIDAGVSIKEVIELSGVLVKYPEIDLTKNQVGIFAKVATLNTKLRDKDRIEIYRSLIADPKEVRKRKAAERKAEKENMKSI